MRVVRHSAPSALLKIAGRWLERDEVRNNVLIGVCARLVDHPSEFASKQFLATLQEGEAVEGVAMMTPPYNLVTSSWPVAQAETWANFLLGCELSLPGIFAPTRQAAAFVLAWQRICSQACRLSMEHTLYECRAVTDISPTTGMFRAARADDVPLLCQWRREFISELGTEDPADTVETVVKQAVAAGSMYVWQDGRVVSAATVGRESRRGATITFVYTPPDCRGRGYATNCVRAVTDDILRQGKKFAALFTDSASAIPNAVYQKIGYKPVCGFQKWSFA